MICERCLSLCGEVAEARVQSEIINVKVCRRCADVARNLGLKVTALNKSPDPDRCFAETALDGIVE
jgi:hypothetical protein